MGRRCWSASGAAFDLASVLRAAGVLRSDLPPCEAPAQTARPHDLGSNDPVTSVERHLQNAPNAPRGMQRSCTHVEESETRRRELPMQRSKSGAAARPPAPPAGEQLHSRRRLQRRSVRGRVRRPPRLSVAAHESVFVDGSSEQSLHWVPQAPLTAQGRLLSITAWLPPLARKKTQKV